MNFRIILTAVWISIASLTFAQKGSISGEVVDQQTKTQIPFANVVLFSDDYSKTMAGSVSDDQGLFELSKLPQGQYNLVISFIGYSNDTLSSVTISQTNQNIALGNITLFPATVSLKEVEVKGDKITAETEMDRVKYNASEFVTAKGGTATDLLNKLPSVSVGPDGTVALRGTTSFMVYLNGKPTQLEPSVLLAQLSADAIENIEIITVPTAKYDAQGKGGIINIVTKRNGADGLSVSANGLLGGAPWGNLTDTYSGYNLNDLRYGGGANLLYVKGKTSIYGGAYYNNKNVNGDRVGDARILQDDGSYYHMVAAGERPEWYENFSFNFGTDFSLSEKSTLSASYYYARRTEGRSAFYVYNNYYGDIDKNPIPGIPVDDDWIYNPNTDTRYGIFSGANIDFRTQFNETSNLSASFLFENSSLTRKLDNRNYDFNEPSDEVGDLEEHFTQSDDTPINGYRFSLDYDKKLQNGQVIGVGLQPQILRQKGDFQYDTLNVDDNQWGSYTSLENSIDLYRGVYAGYVDYTGKAEKFEFAVGLRLEYTDQNLELANPDYFSIFDRPAESTYVVEQLDWFPTVHLDWTINKIDHLILSGSRRINRPPTKEMAPFLYRRHYEVYVVGDPALKPEYISNIEMTYNKIFGEQSLALTGFFRGTENAIFRVNTVYPDENVLIRSITNSGNSNALGAELNGNFAIGPKITMFAGGSLYNFRVTGEAFGYEENNRSTNWSLKGNINWNVTIAFELSADFDYKSATVTAQGELQSFYTANAVVTYSPPKLKDWSFALRGLDLLASNIEALYTRAYDKEETEIFYQDVQYNRNGPILELGINYAFNSNEKNKKKAKKTFGDEQF